MKKIWIAIIAIVVLAGVFIVTVPKKADHIEVIKQELVNNDESFANSKVPVLDYSILGAELDYSLSYKNHVFFSTTTYEGEIISRGFLGHVVLDKNNRLIFKNEKKKANENPTPSAVSRTVFITADGKQDDYLLIEHKECQDFYYAVQRMMSAKEPQRKQYISEQDYLLDLERWNNDPFYGWSEKNNNYNITSGLKIYTTIDTRIQTHAYNAVYEYMPMLQEEFNKEKDNNPTFPFVKGTKQEEINKNLRALRRWSDTYRQLKEKGVSEDEITAQFDVSAEMEVFNWAAKKKIKATLTPNEAIYQRLSLLSPELFAMDPTTGEVKAYINNITGEQVGNSIAHQIGTSIQPFIYAHALEDSETPCTTYSNDPVVFIVEGRDWVPSYAIEESYTAIGKGVTIKWGLCQSSNNLCGRLVKNHSSEENTAFLNKFHLSSQGESATGDKMNALLTIGAVYNTLPNLSSSYNVFANKGKYVYPVYVTRIEDKDGNVLYQNKAVQQDVIRDINAHYMLDMLESTADYGTSQKLRSDYGIGSVVASKTGSTQDGEGAFFLGSVPHLTTGVWVGWTNKNVHFSEKQKNKSEKLALPLWAIFIRNCYNDKTLSVSANDTFQRHPNAREVTCTGGNEDVFE